MHIHHTVKALCVGTAMPVLPICSRLSCEVSSTSAPRLELPSASSLVFHLQMLPVFSAFAAVLLFPALFVPVLLQKSIDGLLAEAAAAPPHQLAVPGTSACLSASAAASTAQPLLLCSAWFCRPLLVSALLLCCRHRAKIACKIRDEYSAARKYQDPASASVRPLAPGPSGHAATLGLGGASMTAPVANGSASSRGKSATERLIDTMASEQR